MRFLAGNRSFAAQLLKAPRSGCASHRGPREGFVGCGADYTVPQRQRGYSRAELRDSRTHGVDARELSTGKWCAVEDASGQNEKAADARRDAEVEPDFERTFGALLATPGEDYKGSDENGATRRSRRHDSNDDQLPL